MYILYFGINKQFFYKDFELRSYETNKYIVIKYETFDESWTDKSNIVNLNGQIMNDAWKLMRYTQGENESKTQMKFLLPVFASVVRLEGEPFKALPHNKGVPLVVKVFISLPKEYQGNQQPPRPLDSDIHIETITSFKCFAK